jgi:hypothetical protein
LVTLSIAVSASCFRAIGGEVPATVHSQQRRIIMTKPEQIKVQVAAYYRN